MSTPDPARPVVLMIWTRPIDGQLMAGRLRVANAVREVFRDVAIVREHVMTPAVSTGSVSALLFAALAWLASWFRGPMLPVQCAIYAGHTEIARAIAAVGPDVDTIYLDGVRTFSLLRALRRRFPDRRVIVDLDDLMSRRMRLLLQARQPLSPGHLIAKLPRFLTRLTTGPLARAIVQYEAWTLPAVEAAITHLADTVVLLSAEDMRALSGTGPARRETILPSVAASGAPPVLKPGRLRFIFIGTDALTQNRLTIDYLLGLWRTHGFAHDLVIYSKQTRGVPLPAGVSAPGYARNIADVYDGRSVLVSPSFLRGGIKTKVLEAFAHGTPVIGNAATFEAMPLEGYPLTIEDEATLLAILRDPEAHRPLLEEGARAGARYLARTHAPGAFAAAWAKTLRHRPAFDAIGAPEPDARTDYRNAEVRP